MRVCGPKLRTPVPGETYKIGELALTCLSVFISHHRLTLSFAYTIRVWFECSSDFGKWRKFLGGPSECSWSLTIISPASQSRLNTLTPPSERRFCVTVCGVPLQSQLCLALLHFVFFLLLSGFNKRFFSFSLTVVVLFILCRGLFCFSLLYFLPLPLFLIF